MRLFPILIALLLAPHAHADDLTALVDSVRETYGGAPAGAKLERHRVLGKVWALARGAHGALRKDFAAPDRLRVEIAYPAGTEVRILDGGKGWRGDAGRLQRVEGPAKVAMVYQALRSTPSWTLHHHRGRLQDRGEQTIGGTRYRLVGLPWSRELDLTFWIDSVNRRVLRVEALIQSRGMRTSFATEYADFRRVDGVLYPFLEENYASGHHTGSTRITEVVFAPPDLGPFDPTRLEP